MNCLLVTLGSHGDVHPFVGIGTAMRQRGHRVTLIANGHFEGLARRAQLDFQGYGDSESYLRLAGNPDLWSKRNGWRVVFGAVLDSLRDVYDAVVRCLDSDTVVVASSLALAARVAQDRHGFPMATVHLSPAVFRSSIAPPKLPGLFMPWWMPLLVRRTMWRAGDRLMFDPFVCPRLNAFRAELGLAPVANVLESWWHSPDLIIGMFPEWFGAKGSDWPAQTVLTGFGLFDERGHESLPDALEEFLEQDDPPIAFTPGSAMLHGHEFFDAAVDACVRLRRRGILLSRHPEHVPASLPPSVIHIPFAPFSELLPRCAALVHHAGIGTTSQALRAGIPQLVMPMTHDQPDNAARIVRLGVGRSIARWRFTGRNVARVLAAFLTQPDLPARCQTIASRFQGDDAVTRTCALIERLGSSRTRRNDANALKSDIFLSV
jgi:rhamnosyltransferase subunit B